MASRGRLNVVVTREDSLSPRSRSGSASPSRNNHPVEEQTPQQMNFQDVVILHRKWRDAKRRAELLQKEVAVLHGCQKNAGGEATMSKGNPSTTTAQTKLNCQELQERVKAVKRLLDTSRLESAKLSRLAVAKSRELNEARKEVARVPELTATVDRLVNAKRAAEKAHWDEGQRAEEEQRRSKAWRAQVDKVSLQAVQSAEHCRVLSSEHGELREELKHVRALLKEAERRGVVAGTVSENLRLKRIEAGLLAEELGAVRQDCGRLVQLISSTKEYSQFRRLWDDSGSLTRLNNARATSSCCATNSTGGGGGGARVAGGAGVATPFGTEGTPRSRGGGAGATGRGTVAANASATTTNCWGRALLSEWASPCETIIDAVATLSTPVEVTAAATVVAAPVAESEDGNGEEGGEKTVLEGRTGAPSRWRRAAGTEVEERGAPPPPRRVWFSSQRGRNEPDSVAAVEALDKAEVSKGRSEAEKRDRGCTVPGKRAEANAIADGVGGGGGPAKTETVRWGRMDLLSVLYPPPAPGKGSGSQIGMSAESSMWVPQEAAGLCRRFVRDFDGYSGVPLDVHQHCLLRSLLLGLNESWRQSERKHVERLTKRYRAELKAAHRRLDMRKPMRVVLAERAAERCQSSPALLDSTAAAASAVKTGGSIARSPRWGADGRRITGRERNQAGCSGTCAECRQRCSACGGKKGAGKAAGGRGARSSGRGGKRVAVGRRQKPNGSSAALTPHGSSEIAITAVPVAGVSTKARAEGATNVSMSNQALLHEFPDDYDRGRGETYSDPTQKKQEIFRRQSRRQQRTAGEERRGACLACGMESSALPPEKILENSDRDVLRDEGDVRATGGKEARYDLRQQVLNQKVFSGRAPSATSEPYHA